MSEIQERQLVSLQKNAKERQIGNILLAVVPWPTKSVEKACQNVDPPSIVLNLPRFSLGNGKLILLDDYGNEYKMVQLPKSIE